MCGMCRQTHTRRVTAGAGSYVTGHQDDREDGTDHFLLPQGFRYSVKIEKQN